MLSARRLTIAAICGCVIACGSGGDGEAEHRLSGDYAVTTSFTSIAGPGVGAAETEAARARFAAVENEHQCFDKPIPRVGEAGPMSRCTYRRVVREHDALRFDATCEAPAGVRSMTIGGTQSSAGYDYRIELTDEGGTTVVSREQGRRVGPCSS